MSAVGLVHGRSIAPRDARSCTFRVDFEHERALACGTVSDIAEEIASQPLGVASRRRHGGRRPGWRSPSRASACGRRLRHVLVRRPGVRGAARGRRRRRDRRLPATELPPSASYDRVVAISRSGTTTEVVDGCSATLRDRDVPTTAITADAGLAGRPAGATTRSSWTSPTSARWCRRASPPARWRCSAPTSARTSTAAIADAGRALPTRCPSSPRGSITSCSSATGWTSGSRTRPR